MAGGSLSLRLAVAVPVAAACLSLASPALADSSHYAGGASLPEFTLPVARGGFTGPDGVTRALVTGPPPPYRVVYSGPCALDFTPTCLPPPCPPDHEARTAQRQWTDGRVEYVGLVCLDTGSVVSQAQLAAAAAEELLRAAPVISALDVQPEGRVLLRYPALFHAADGTEPFTRTFTAYGLPVRLDAAPVRFTWTTSDGARQVTDHNGKRYDGSQVKLPGGGVGEGYVAHTFTESGDASVTLTVAWQGRWTVAGLTGGTLDQIVTRTSPPAQVVVSGARSQLVR